MEYNSDNVKLYCGDCIELMNGMQSESVDLIIADPPYRMTKRGKSCRPNWMPNNMGENVFTGKLPDTEKWFFECYRVLKQNTHFYTFCNTNSILEYLEAANRTGFKLHNIIVMKKDTGMPNRWYLKNTELVLFFRKGKAKPINDCTSRDWFEVKMPTAKNGKVHITQKPIGVVQKFIENSSLKGEVVLDPFMGSGTTGAACVKTGRKFIGIELDNKYFDIAKNRIEKEIAWMKGCETCKNFEVSFNGCTPDYDCKLSSKCKDYSLWEQKK